MIIIAVLRPSWVGFGMAHASSQAHVDSCSTMPNAESIPTLGGGVSALTHKRAIHIMVFSGSCSHFMQAARLGR